MKKRLLLDMDGIVVDFLGTFLEIYNNLQDDYPPATKADITTWDLGSCLPDQHAVNLVFESLANEDTWMQMRFLDPCVATYMEIWNEAFDLHLVSFALGAAAKASKHRWVNQMLPWMNGRRLSLVADKYIIKGDILIDDRAETLRKYRMHWPGAKLATVRYPYHNPDDPVPNGTFLAESYADPGRAWALLHQYVMEQLG